MTDTSSQQGIQSPAPQQAVSPTEPPAKTPDELILPCSANTCTKGHKWMPQLQVAACPGCNSPVLAIKMQNCPVCNEPCRSLRLRSDHFAGGAIMPICRGGATLAEVASIEIEHQHYIAEQQRHTPREMISKV